MFRKHFKRMVSRKYEKKKTGLNGHVYDFSVDYNAITADDILGIDKYLMKKKMI